MYTCIYVCHVCHVMHVMYVLPFSPQSMSWEIQYSPYRSRPSSRLSDIDQHANGLPHMRQLEFTPHSTARRRRDESGVRDEARKKSEESVRDTFQREPTPASALFSGHGFELARKLFRRQNCRKHLHLMYQPHDCHCHLVGLRPCLSPWCTSPREVSSRFTWMYPTMPL